MGVAVIGHDKIEDTTSVNVLRYWEGTNRYSGVIRIMIELVLERVTVSKEPKD